MFPFTFIFCSRQKIFPPRLGTLAPRSVSLPFKSTLLSKWWRQKSCFDSSTPATSLSRPFNRHWIRLIASVQLTFNVEKLPTMSTGSDWKLRVSVFKIATLLHYSSRVSRLANNSQRSRKHFFNYLRAFQALPRWLLWSAKAFSFGWWWLSLIRTFICSPRRNSKQRQSQDGKHFKSLWRAFITKRNFLFYRRHGEQTLQKHRFGWLDLLALLSSCLRIHSD